MKQDYLQLSRNYKPKGGTAIPVPEQAEKAHEAHKVDSRGDMSEHQEPEIIKAVESQASDVDVGSYVALPEPIEPIVATYEAYPLAGVTYSEISGEWDHKSTLSGKPSPLHDILALQTWLVTVDWNRGLRCGRDGRQCKVCKGVPCHGSTEWPG